MDEEESIKRTLIQSEGVERFIRSQEPNASYDRVEDTKEANKFILVNTKNPQ